MLDIAMLRSPSLEQLQRSYRPDTFSPTAPDVDGASLKDDMDDASHHSDHDTNNNTNTNEDQDTEGLGLYDILCGRHKAAFNNIGNRRFRVTVSLALPRYMAAPSRKDKSVVIKSVKALVQNNGGRFMQKRKAGWVELTPKQAHEKVGHALRDAAMAKSSEQSQPGNSTSNNNSAAAAMKQQQQQAAAAAAAAPPPMTSAPAAASGYQSQSAAPAAPEPNEAVFAVLESFQQSMPHAAAASAAAAPPPLPALTSAVSSTMMSMGDFSDWDMSFTQKRASSNWGQPPALHENVTFGDLFATTPAQQQQQEQQQQQHQPQLRRPTVDDNMLSWLVGESGLLLDNSNSSGLNLESL